MVWEENFEWLFYHFDVLKSKTSRILLNKNINFNKSETESKMKNPIHCFERRGLYFSSYKNCKLKVKLWWVGVCKRKKRAFFVPFILSEGIFFNICVLSYFVVYWIQFQNTHTFPHFLHFLSINIIENLQCILFLFQVGCS